MKISDRIALLVKHKNMSVRSFEQAIGASNGLLSKAISKSTDISSQWVSKIIEAYPEVNSNWLLTGNGEMIINYEADKKMIADAIANPIDIDFTGESYKKNPSLTALIKIGDKFYSANRLSELEDIIKEIKDKS